MLVCRGERVKLHTGSVVCSFSISSLLSIGPRMGAPDRLNEIWYQSLNQMEMAPALVGGTRESCARYFSHFLRHWAYRKDAFDDVLEQFIDNFLKPGNL